VVVDYYCRAKIEADALVAAYPRVDVVRPSWIYGPRDRTTIPRVVAALREGRARIVADAATAQHRPRRDVAEGTSAPPITPAAPAGV